MGMDPITVYIDHNEYASPRAAKLEKAIAKDDRFSLPEAVELDVDLRFMAGWRAVRVELKEPADFVSSVLSGHLYDQVLTLRERGDPCFVVVLGDYAEAILNAACHAGRAHANENVKSYSNRCRDFEANSYALGVPIFVWGDSPWPRLLSYAHKILAGPDLIAHRPKPADGERQVAALCMLVKGLGPVRARALLAQYGNLANVVNVAGPGEPAISCQGIGPRTIEAIKGAMWG